MGWRRGVDPVLRRAAVGVDVPLRRGEGIACSGAGRGDGGGGRSLCEPPLRDG